MSTESKNKEKTKSKFIIFYLILAILVIAMINYYFSLFGDEAAPKKESKYQPDIAQGLKVCTESVIQPECYDEDSVNLELSWRCEDGETFKGKHALALQVADNEDFNSPAVDVTEKEFSGETYQIDSSKLQDSQTYYWRIKVQDEKGTWSSWATHEEPFTIAPLCE